MYFSFKIRKKTRLNFFNYLLSSFLFILIFLFCFHLILFCLLLSFSTYICYFIFDCSFLHKIFIWNLNAYIFNSVAFSQTALEAKILAHKTHDIFNKFTWIFTFNWKIHCFCACVALGFEISYWFLLTLLTKENVLLKFLLQFPYIVRNL